MRDFYERQATARKETQYLVVLFVMAIAFLVVVTSAILSNALFLIRTWLGEPHPPVLDPWVMLGTGCITLLIIVVGCGWKAQQLQAGGGVALAALLQARLIRESEQMAASERKLLNVVQEIAISAGIAPPHVCVLDQDRGINAFAAGFTLRDAVIGVTRGCIEKLSRDQLQGVIAHEFSHILNGDMLLNMRALIALHGVFSIDILGRWLLIVARQYWVEADNLQENFAGKMAGSIGLAILGTLLIAMGSLGTLCGLFISAAMSRQREFLADASAVELTRNPRGIADALKVIGGFPTGTRVRSVLATEVNHMCFCPATRQFASGLASHPPLEQRILRLDPEWDGVPMFEEAGTLEGVPEPLGDAMQLVGAGYVKSSHSDDSEEPSYFAGDHEASYLRAIDSTIPDVLHELGESPTGCGLLLLALAWKDSRRKELTPHLRKLGPEVEQGLSTIYPVIASLPDIQRFRLLDLARDRWQSLTPESRRPMAECLQAILRDVKADDWFSWSIRQELRSVWMPGQKAASAKWGSYREVAEHCEVLLSALVYAGHEAGPTAEYAFRRAAVHFEGIEIALLDVDQCGPTELSQAVEHLALLSPRAKRSLLLAVSRCISADHTIVANEASIVRGVCAALRVTVPRLIPGQPVVGL